MFLKSRILVVVWGILTVLSAQAIAQDAAITDEELTKYAKVMSVVEAKMAEMRTKISEEVKGNEMMDGGRLYNALNKTKGDSTKVAETGATPEQLEAYANIQDYINQLKAAFKEQKTQLIKEDLGIKAYKKIKSALKKDADLKEKYKQVLTSLVTTERSQTE